MNERTINETWQVTVQKESPLRKTVKRRVFFFSEHPHFYSAKRSKNGQLKNHYGRVQIRSPRARDKRSLPTPLTSLLWSFSDARQPSSRISLSTSGFDRSAFDNPRSLQYRASHTVVVYRIVEATSLFARTRYASTRKRARKAGRLKHPLRVGRFPSWPCLSVRANSNIK